MSLRTLYSLLILVIATNAYSQKERTTKFGQASLEELKMESYTVDPEAAALVLFEQANYYRNPLKDYNFSTEVYRRVKIFDKIKAAKESTISVYAYKDETISDIKAVTYNLKGDKIESFTLSKDQIFTIQETEDFKKVTFTLPNIKSGCVIEYSYSKNSPYLSIQDWSFQSDIPKLRSEFLLAIQGNYRYNTRLVGFLDLDISENSVKTDCFSYPDGTVIACAIYTYAMNNIPAFEKEDYMLSKKNYLSKISHDLQSIITKQQTGSGYTQSVKTKVENVTKTWKDADKSLKTVFLNNQGSKKNFFKKKLSKEILNQQDELIKTKMIYNFIQDHFTWNEKNWISSNIDVKESFSQRSGSVDAINLSLYNSLQGAGIESYITLVSTRSNGMPTKLFPVISDFNYLIVKAVINGEDYFLDATDKYRPFAEVPFKCLNGEARVFDFKKGSYWQNINRSKRAEKKIISDIQFNDDGNLVSKQRVTSSRYYANNIRHEYFDKGEDEYITNFESEARNSEIENYEIKDLNIIEKPVTESYELIGDEDLLSSNKVRINPVINPTFSSNPFKLNERLYPVDFGHTSSVLHRITFTAPEGYKVSKIPTDIGIKLPNNGGNYVYKVQQKENVVKIYIRFQLTKKVFSGNEYLSLKDFFNKIITAEDGFIEIEKI